MGDGFGVGLGSSVFVVFSVGENSGEPVGLEIFVGMRVAAGTSFNLSGVGESVSASQAVNNSARKIIAVNNRGNIVFFLAICGYRTKKGSTLRWSLNRSLRVFEYLLARGFDEGTEQKLETLLELGSL